METWIAISKQDPPSDETVWLYNDKTKNVVLGCLAYVPNEGYCWAVCNDGIIYSKDGKIVAEAEYDDYEFTHWHPLPLLP